MASTKLLCFVSALLVPTLLVLCSHHVACKDSDEDTLLQGINSYRNSLKLTPLSKNDKAGCLADEIANHLEDKPCVTTTAANAIPGTGPQLTNYQDQLSKCKIDINNTKDGVILPVCVPKLVPTLVLTNYTRTGYSRYLNDSRFMGVGVGSEDDWMVVVLSTSTQGGSFATGGKVRSVSSIGVVVKCLTVLVLIVNWF